MVARSSKAKRGPPAKSKAKSKAKRARSKPLLAVDATMVRTAKPHPKTRTASNGKSPISPTHPQLTMIAMVGRVLDAYAEFPARLARCRSPMDIWFEQARFVQRVFSGSSASTDRPLWVVSR
jgi:hypothetical protein